MSNNESPSTAEHQGTEREREIAEASAEVAALLEERRSDFALRSAIRISCPQR